MSPKPRSLRSLRLPIPHSQHRASVPAVALGTWMSLDGQIIAATTEALKIGYRHIDTASMYMNEKSIGRGLQRWLDHDQSNRREDVWLTSKVWNTNHDPNRVRASVDRTLSDLGTDYVDLMLVHWPVDLSPSEELLPNGAIRREGVTLEETWQAFEEVLASGKARQIGVSNFTQAQLDLIIRKGRVVPSFLQMELHPYLQRSAYVKYAQSLGIVVQAFSPYGNLNETYDKSTTLTIEHETVKEIARRMQISPAQVVLSWNVTRGVNVLPKSLEADQLAQNLDLYELSPEDMQLMSSIDLNLRFSQEPASWAHSWDQSSIYPAWAASQYSRPEAKTILPSPQPPAATPIGHQGMPLTALLTPLHEPTSTAAWSPLRLRSRMYR